MAGAPSLGLEATAGRGPPYMLDERRMGVALASLRLGSGASALYLCEKKLIAIRKRTKKMIDWDSDTR